MVVPRAPAARRDQDRDQLRYVVADQPAGEGVGRPGRAASLAPGVRSVEVLRALAWEPAASEPGRRTLLVTGSTAPDPASPRRADDAPAYARLAGAYGTDWEAALRQAWIPIVLWTIFDARPGAEPAVEDALRARVGSVRLDQDPCPLSIELLRLEGAPGDGATYVFQSRWEGVETFARARRPPAIDREQQSGRASLRRPARVRAYSIGRRAYAARQHATR